MTYETFEVVELGKAENLVEVSTIGFKVELDLETATRNIYPMYADDDE